jgi:putative transposase
LRCLVLWLGLALSTFYTWRTRYGKANEHNAQVPRDHWLEDWEKQAIVDFQRQNPTEGCRKLAFMMLDEDVVAVGPTTVYRVLKQQGRLRPASPPNPRKGKGFHQPGRPHRDWHTDISSLNIAGTFYFLISVIEGYSRMVLHWEIREKMTKTDAEIVVQRALEKYPGEHPRIITDNGSQYTSREFKQFIRLMGMTHIRTSPYYPQSNGKQERWHGTLKQECIRPHVPLSLEDARRLVAQYVAYYNHVRLHSAIGYVAPADRLFGLDPVIHTERDRKLEAAREQRRLNRQAARATVDDVIAPSGTASDAAAIDFQLLRERISIEQVLRHLGFWEEMHGTPPQLRGPCPIHDDGDRRHDSFSVHARKNIFRCFHAECGISGNVLDLWAAVRRLPLPEAARDLAATFNVNLAELALLPRRMGIREEEPVSPSSSPLESDFRFAMISESPSPH